MRKCDEEVYQLAKDQALVNKQIYIKKDVLIQNDPAVLLCQ